MSDVNAPTESPEFSRVLPWVSFVALLFLLNYLDRAMFGPMLPYLEREFSINHAESTRLLLYTSLGYSASLVVSGFVAARVRPRIMAGGSLVVCGGVMLGLASTHSLDVIALCMALLGAAAGQYFNGGLSTMRGLVAPSQWSKAIAVHEIGPNGSFILGPLLAGAAADSFGWRGVTTGMGWLSLAVGVLFLLFAKGGHERSAPVSFAGVGRLVRSPRLWLCTWLMSLAIAGEFAPYSVLTLHLTDERGMSAEGAAFLLAVSRLASPVAVLCGGWVTTRLGTRRTLVFCLWCYALGMCFMAMPPLPVMYAGLFLQPMMTAMLFPPIFTMLAEFFPPTEQPVILSIVMPLASFFGVGMMPYILGIWGDFVSFNAGFLMMGLLVAASLPMMKFLR